MSKLVLDASVAVKWYLDEPDDRKAQEIVARNLTLMVPEILHLEMQSAFVRAYRNGRFSRPQTESATARWHQEGRKQFIWFANEDLETSAVCLSLDSQHAFYDCLYLALAQQEACTLVTADDRFAERARAIYPQVVLLVDYGK